MIVKHDRIKDKQIHLFLERNQTLINLILKI